MMAVAPLTFFIASKFGRLTGVNTPLIRRYGDSLKELCNSTNFIKSVLLIKEKKYCIIINTKIYSREEYYET